MHETAWRHRQVRHRDPGKLRERGGIGRTLIDHTHLGRSRRRSVRATALSAYADLIVSGDGHLLNLKYFHGIDIVNAAEAHRRVAEERSTRVDKSSPALLITPEDGSASM